MTLREDGTWDVATNQGVIRAKRVVNACGKLDHLTLVSKYFPLQPTAYVRYYKIILPLKMATYNQCDQIGRFIGRWATF